MGSINIVCDFESDWILPRLGKHLVSTIPKANACKIGRKNILNSEGVALNYYLNDNAMLEKSKNFDVVFFDHPKPCLSRTLKQANHIIAMAPQYQRMIQEHGAPCDLVIQPTDPVLFCPKLVLGFVGRFKGRTDYSDRKGRNLLERISKLPFVEIKSTLGNLPEEDLPAFYRSVDYPIVTSKEEGGPMCFTEALRCGKRIIMPLTLGIGEMFPQGVIDYPEGDYEGLCKVLEGLYAERVALSKLVEPYTWDFWTEQHERIFFKLINENNLSITFNKEIERLIVVVATPEIATLLKHTLPAIEAYAKKCNAELLVWRDCPPEYQHPKYRLMGLKNINAKRILHLDADCCPKPDAPDIFDQYPEGFIYSWDEMEVRKLHVVQGFQKIIDKHTGESVEWDNHWWNPGVMLLDKKHLRIFEMPKWDVTDKEHLWFGNTIKNQPWINWRIRRCGEIVKPLDRRFNCVTSLLDSNPNDAYILHFGAEKIPDAYSRKISMAEEFSPLTTNNVSNGKNKYKCALATVVSGSDAIKLHEITGPFMEKYACECGYDFKIIKFPKKKGFWPSPSWWKLELVKLFDEGYDVVVFIDNDIFIKPETPPICEEVPRGMFGAFNSFTLASMKKAGCDCNVSCRNWLSAVGVSDIIPQNQPFLVNAGVWVCWKEAKDILRCDNPKEFDKYVEQHQVNLNLWRNPHLYYQLDHKWNFGHLHVTANYVGALSDDVYFVHLNGVSVSERCSLLKKFICEWENRKKYAEKNKKTKKLPPEKNLLIKKPFLEKDKIIRGDVSTKKGNISTELVNIKKLIGINSKIKSVKVGLGVKKEIKKDALVQRNTVSISKKKRRSSRKRSG